MNDLQLPIRRESDEKDWRAGKTATLNKDFLEDGLKMTQPMVRKAWLVTRANVTTGAGTGGQPASKGANLFHMYELIVVKDRSGQRINCSGGDLRDIAQSEMASKFRMPADIPHSTTTDVEFRLPILFSLADKAGDPNDTAMLLRDFYSGGVMSLSFKSGAIGGGDATAGDITVNTATWTIEVDIEDYGSHVVPSRLAWESTPLIAKKSGYPINGKLRAAYLSVGDENRETGDTWDSDGETLESTSLGYQSLKQTHFINAYLEEDVHDESIDSVALNYLLPVFFPKRGQQITDMPVFDTLNVKFSQNLPTDAKLVTGVYTARDPETIALAFPTVAPADLTPMLKSGGVVPGLRGDRAASAFPLDQRKYLPIKFASRGVVRSPNAPVGNSSR